MSRPTIKEMRTRDAVKLAERLTKDPTPEEITEAVKTMRKFYRFAAAYYSAFTVNNMRSTSEAEKEAADAKSERAYKRAAEALKRYNLRISCPGLYPIIEDAETRINFTYGHYYT